MQTQGNTILITGGGSGIGRGLAESFHALGNTVVIAGRSQAKLDDTTAANPGMQALTLDITDPGDINRFAAEVVERFPELNALINNAGVMLPEDLADPGPAGSPATGSATGPAVGLSAAELTVATNLLGPIRLTSALLPHLRAQPNASVLNVTSGLAFVPMATTPTYCATKAALHSYTISLRQQLKGSGVEVIELIPPYVQTHLTGEHQATDARAMPLRDYIEQTMAVLTSEPDQTEVIIDRVAPLRHAETRGTIHELVGMLHEMGRERLETARA